MVEMVTSKTGRRIRPHGLGRALLACFGLLACLAATAVDAQQVGPGGESPEAARPQISANGSAMTASADWTGEAEACFNAVETPHDGVVLCTKAIEAGGLSLENLAITYSNRGNSFFDLRRFHRAVDDYNIALGLVPDDPVTLSNRGAAYTDLGEHALALADLSRALEIDPVNATAWANRCWVHALLEDFETAIADCTKAVELAPNDPVPLASRAFARLSLNDIPVALVDANRAVELGPTLWEAYFYRGLIHEARRDRSKAIEDLSRAFELGPDEPRIIEAMAELGFQLPADQTAPSGTAAPETAGGADGGSTAAKADPAPR